MSRPPVQPHIVLTGPMGAGKTTVGRKLADALGRPLLDSDLQLEERFGASGAVLASRRGLAPLHLAEAEALREALGSRQPSVVAAAASVCDLPDVAELLGGPDVMAVLLTGDSAVLASRAESGSHRRPVDEAAYRRLTAQREERVAPVVDLVVDVTDSDPDTVTEEILDAYRRRSAASSEGGRHRRP